MAKCSVMFFVLCSLLVLQMITAYPEGDVGTPLGAPLAGEGVVKDVSANSSEEKNESKSSSSSSSSEEKEKKDELHPID